MPYQDHEGAGRVLLAVCQLNLASCEMLQDNKGVHLILGLHDSCGAKIARNNRAPCNPGARGGSVIFFPPKVSLFHSLH